MKTKALNKTITFRSPINRETSFSETQLAQDTESSIEIVARENGTGYFEWDVPELQITEEGMLRFEGNMLMEYDGVFALPQQLLDALKEEGYDVSEVE